MNRFNSGASAVDFFYWIDLVKSSKFYRCLNKK